MKQRALQTVLDPALPGVEVTTVGRVADFERQLGRGQDAVLALPLVLAVRGLSPSLQGRSNGMPDEAYSLVGTTNEPDPRTVRVIGAVDILGRRGTTSFVRSMVDSNPRVERVSKVEDLLALLQMRRAEAVLLPERLVDDLKGASRLPLFQHRLGPRVGLPAVGTLSKEGTKVVAAVSRMSSSVSRFLGVDEWK